MAKCNSCKFLKFYFDRELQNVIKDKERLEAELGPDVYLGMKETIKAYHKIVSKQTEQCK